VIGHIFIAVLGLAALIVGVVTIWYVVSFLVLSGVSRLLPLTGRRPREKRTP
jgi:membrane protein implicated in regulation of membrane protease activity